MRNTKFPLPKKYWMYVILCAALGILLFVYIFITNGITGEKEFWDLHSRTGITSPCFC